MIEKSVVERGEKGNGIRDGTIGKELYFKIGEIFYNSLECISETRFFHMIFLPLIRSNL